MYRLTPLRINHFKPLYLPVLPKHTLFKVLYFILFKNYTLFTLFSVKYFENTLL